MINLSSNAPFSSPFHAAVSAGALDLAASADARDGRVGAFVPASNGGGAMSPFDDVGSVAPASRISKLLAAPFWIDAGSPAAAMVMTAAPRASADKVLNFSHKVDGGVKLERGQDGWRVVCEFDVGFDLDATMPATDRLHYEYRQFVRGQVRVRRAGQPWSSVPVADASAAGAADVGLGADWIEDACTVDGRQCRYGHRPTSLFDAGAPGEHYGSADSTAAFGASYRLHRAMEVSGDGEALEVAVNLEFQGMVVEVSRNPDTGQTTVVRVLKSQGWALQQPNLCLDAVGA